jgi:hypothetical protein
VTWLMFMQLLVDFAFLSVTAFFWIKLRRPPQDDPRLSRGLQLLQSKITVLEDLSDRTDAQVKQLTQILDQKTRYIQDKIVQAEQQILKIDQSMEKSLEVAEIFQDKIPHAEVLERKRTVEYVKAARLAHQGRNAAEISEQVDLPREQIELIAKFNREQLMFDEEALPAWAKTGIEKPADAPLRDTATGNMDFLQSLETSRPDLTNLNSIGEKFKSSVRNFEASSAPGPQAPAPKLEGPSADFDDTSAATRAILGAAQSISNSLTATAAIFLNMPEPAAKKTQPIVKKVEFPRIQMPPK